jgi:ATP-dependent Clp protease ATP-binding subunit ClpA
MRSSILDAVLKSAADDAKAESYAHVSIEHVLQVILRGIFGYRLRKYNVPVHNIQVQLAKSITMRPKRAQYSDPTYCADLNEVLAAAERGAEKANRQASLTEFLLAVLVDTRFVASKILVANGVQVKHLFPTDPLDTYTQSLLDVLESRKDDISDTQSDEDSEKDEEFGYSYSNLARYKVNFTQGKAQSEITRRDDYVKPRLDREEAEALSEFTINLTEQAKKGHINRLIGREDELNAVMLTLSRRSKNTPLLVGEPGVGKTEIVKGLALAIEKKDVPESLLNFEIYSLDAAALIAGTTYRGEFEKRMTLILSAIVKLKRAILFIDEIHAMIGLGSASGSSSGSALLKPKLEDGTLKVIGSTTYTEFRQIVEQDAAFTRRFHKIDVLEPTQEEALLICQGVQEVLESHHHVKYTPTALTAAVELSSKYMLTKFLPDKALDLLDLAGAKKQLAGDTGTVDRAEIETVLAETLRLPVTSVSDSDIKSLKRLKKSLQEVVFGQDEAIETVVKAITLARLELNHPTKPTGSFLFSGPTGVGKTELVKRLAEQLHIPLVRFDMSEYKESHSVAKLIGSPPGYVAHEQGGLLVEAVTQNPHCVILLDEIEKAHPDIYNILLQIMDYGTLTDSQGRVGNFHHVILILTTNAGSADAETTRVCGFAEEVPDNKDIEQQAVNLLFTPEFRNRLDAHIHFKHIARPVLKMIVGKYLTELNEMLEKHAVTLKLSPKALDFLLEKGYDKNMGARPMARTIQKYVKDVLVAMMLKKKVKGAYVVNKVGDELQLVKQ